MTEQETYAKFQKRFTVQTNKIALRILDGVIHAYPMRGFVQKWITIPMGLPLCGVDIRFMAATALPTADYPTCVGCLETMRKALGRK